MRSIRYKQPTNTFIAVPFAIQIRVRVVLEICKNHVRYTLGICQFSMDNLETFCKVCLLVSFKGNTKERMSLERWNAGTKRRANVWASDA